MSIADPAQRAAVLSAAPRRPARRHLAWLAGGTVVSFMVPFVVADRLGLQRDVYCGVYIVAVAGLFVAWARDTGQSCATWPRATGAGPPGSASRSRA